MRMFIQAVVAAVLLGSVFSVVAQTGARAAPHSSDLSAPSSDKGAVPAAHAKVASLNEGFDNIGTLAGAGWFLQNNSLPIGLQPGWFQGIATTAAPTPGPFNAFDGAGDAYIAANFQNVTGANTISNWLVTPPLEFGDGATLSFYTRKPTPNPTDFPDRLEVRISTNGASTNVGTGSAAVGDFTTVALSINPTLVVGGYPLTWTQYTITNASGLPRNGTGRVAFRYHVTNGGPTGTNSDYIGIDRVVYAGGTPSFQVSGAVSGLLGSGLSLALNGGTPIAISANGGFQFPDWIPVNGSYAVTATNPANPSQTCTVTNGSGTVTGNVTNVQVACVTDTFTVGGSVSGLAGSGLVLQNNAGDDLPIAADGSFTFATALDDLSAYNVTVLTSPGSPSQTCVVGSGSGNVAAADVTGVTVDCSTDSFTIGGSVSGLLGTGLVLQNNGDDDIAVGADGGFTFATALVDLSGYAVTVLAQPGTPSQTCTVSNGSGNLAGANVASVEVSCSTDSFTVGGTVAGLLGSGLVLQNNAGDDLSIAADGSFTFATAIVDGSEYSVTVSSDPSLPAQSCSVTGGDGSLEGAAVTDVLVDCITDAFTLSIVAGSGQSANLETGFADALTVSLTDGDNAPVPNSAVTFEAPTTGASATLDDGAQAPGTTLAIITDAAGEASVLATANDSAGCYGVAASAAGAPDSVAFELTNVDPAPPGPAVFEDGFETAPAMAKGIVVCGN